MSGAEVINDPILVLVDHEPSGDAWALTSASDKVVRLASELTTGDTYVLSLVANPDEAALKLAGADVVYVAEATGLSPRVAAGVADAALAAIEKIGNLGAVLSVSTYTGRAVTAMLGAKLRSGSAVDVNEVEIVNGSFVARKTALSGAWSTSFEITVGFPILAMRAGAGSENEVEPGSLTVQSLPVELSRGAKAVTVNESRPVAHGQRIGLGEAEVAVVGGRGVDGDFTLVESLADALGGAVGATRVACDEGWVERSAQIGQTGVSISPKLYVGLGVSGAVHHTCGMLASETIVAVVDDPDAHIAEIADFTVIGDVTEVVPAALAALKARQNGS